MARKDLTTLAAAVERHTGADGDYETAVPGLWLYRSSTPSEEHAVVYVPSLCVVMQGAKEVVVGGQVYRYDPAQSLLVSVDMPALTHVADATPDRPCLAVRVPVDPAVVGELLADGTAHPPGPPTRGIGVINLESPLLDAVGRLLGLLDAPHEIPALAPLVLREITFRLLTGPEGARLRQIASAGAPAQRIARAIRWLRDHFAEPLRVEALAQQVGMSPSALHLHFKSVTALSPLQYQKRLKLQEARRLMLAEGLDAGEAAFRVGYESPSQFGREYLRMFGASPRRDVAALKAGAHATR
ncbi:AraC family transcriptional regulator N-terminal domain-containing protein [Gemmata sp.]|uniref:AraC family transcriptional regulator n=1 Tax=Gemmata sp. TaxID=1914242 RepID=UPI003F6E9872